MHSHIPILTSVQRILLQSALQLSHKSVHQIMMWQFLIKFNYKTMYLELAIASLVEVISLLSKQQMALQWLGPLALSIVIMLLQLSLL